MVKKSIPPVLSFLIYILLMINITYGQNQPVTVSTQVIPPYSPYFSDYIGQNGGFNSQYTDIIMVTLQNNDFNNSYQVKLKTEISNTNNVTVTQSPSFMPSQPIHLAPGELRLVNLSELATYNGNINANHFNFSGISYNQVAQTGVLPEGIYQICMQALDYNSSQPLSTIGCSPNFMIVHLDPPMITYPLDEMEVDLTDPQNIMFNWTPPPGGSGTFGYTFRMIEMDNYNNAPEYIMDNTNYSFYREENISTPNLLYDMSKPQLEAGKTYAVKVTANDPQNQIMLKNDGQSEVITFTLKDEGNEDNGELADGNEETFACGGNCNFDIASANQSPVNTLSQGDTIKAGHFKVVITSLSWSGNTLSGDGKILPSSFLPVPISADIQNIQINENGRMISGKIQAKARNTNLLTSDMLSEMGSQISLPNVSSRDLFNHLNDPNYLISDLQNNTEVALPLGMGMPNDPYKASLVGFNLKPEQATLNAALMVKVPDEQNKYLTFGNKNVCLNPSGLAVTDSSQLELLNDVNIKISEDLHMALDKYTAASGTYAVIDCDGFKHISLEGQFKFSPELIRYENADGSPNETDTVKVDFSTSITEWADWLVTLDMVDENNRRYQFPEINDYSFKITQAVFDHSDLENDPSLIFPDAYSANDQNTTWQGLYIKEFNMMMPRFIEKNNNERVEITASNILVDQHGVSTFLEAFKPLNKSEGKIGDWAFSVDYFAIELTASQLDSTALQGEILMPVSDSSFGYSSQMSFISGSLDYNFFLESKGKANLPMWYAQVDLYESSSLDLNIADNSDVTIEAVLNGKMDFDEEIGTLDKVNIKGIEFEQLVVRNKPDYLQMNGAFGLNSSQSASLLGFGANLQGGSGGSDGVGGSFDMSLDDISTNQIALTLSMGLNFTGEGDQNSLSGNTSVVIASEYDLNNAEWKGTDVSISEIQVDAAMGIAELHGKINFFENDPTYGKGFKGQLNASMLESFNVTSNSLFGTIDDYRYWYVDGTISWLPAGIGWAGIGIYGFGGGVFYNMERTAMQSPEDVNNEQNDIQLPYDPKDGSMGLKATVITGLQGESSVWNADATFEVGWNSNGGLTQLSVFGDSYFSQNIQDRQYPKFKGSMDITYDFQQSVLSGEIDTEINLPARNPSITGDGTTAFHFGPNYWFIKAGEPDDRMNFDVDLSALSFSNQAYFMTGSQIPGMPPIPSEIRQYLGYNQVPTRPNEGAIAGGAGFAHGLAMDLSIDKLDAVVCWVDASIDAGYDISVMDWSANGVTCNGRNDFGFNKWYARGQVYFLAKARFYGSHHNSNEAYFRCSLGAIAEGGLPNPTGIKGKVKATFDVGPFTWDPEKSFYLGEICTMEIPDDTEPDIENPFEDVEFISRLSPENGSSEVSPLTPPEADFNYPVDEEQEYVFSDGLGGSVTAQYKIDYDFYIRKNNTNERVDIQTVLSGNNKSLSVNLNETMEPLTDYLAVLETELKQKSGRRWVTVLDQNGNPIKETKTNLFTTSEKKKLTDADIAQTVPVKRQRYFKKGDYQQGSISFTNNMSNFFAQYQEDNIQVKFISHDGSDSHVVDANLNNYSITFPISGLQNETMYNLKLLAVADEEEEDDYYASESGNSGGSYSYNGSGYNFGGGFGGGINVSDSQSEDIEFDPTIFADVIYEYWFRTSMFNTMQEKVSSLSAIYSDKATEQVGSYSSTKLELNIQGAERFEGYYDNKDYEREFNLVNFRMQHTQGMSNNFLPYWYIYDVTYPVTNSQSWTTKAKYQILNQESPYDAFDQQPYEVSGDYGSYTTPHYFDGPLTDSDIQYGWEPDYSNNYSGAGTGSGGGIFGSNNNQFSNNNNYDFSNSGSNVMLSTTYFNFGGVDFGDSSGEDHTTVLSVDVTLDKEIYQKFKDDTEPYIFNEANQQMQGNQILKGPTYRPLPRGNYKLRILFDNSNTLSKTINFSY